MDVSSYEHSKGDCQSPSHRSPPPGYSINAHVRKIYGRWNNFFLASKSSDKSHGTIVFFMYGRITIIAFKIIVLQLQGCTVWDWTTDSQPGTHLFNFIFYPRTFPSIQDLFNLVCIKLDFGHSCLASYAEVCWACHANLKPKECLHKRLSWVYAVFFTVIIVEV